MTSIKLPPLIKWIVAIVITYLILMMLLRVTFFIHFKDEAHTFANSMDAFILGLRYDLRMACAFVLPIFLLGSLSVTFNSNKWSRFFTLVHLFFVVIVMIAFVLYLKSIHAGAPILIAISLLFIVFIGWLITVKTCNPFLNTSVKKVWKAYLLVITFILLLFYAVDFEHYDYLHQRLNASVINYTEDAKISFGMVWQTYPVINLVLGIFLLLLIMTWLFNIWYKIINRKITTSGAKNVLPYAILFFLLALSIFGRAGQYPLRWSDAFGFADDYKASVSLNPVQSFFSTLQFRNSGYDIKKVKQYYPLMVSYLNVQKPDSVHLNYLRNVEAHDSSRAKPNVVLVICESFSAYKSSMWGNPLNTTPYFNELCKQGVFFDHCFTPTFGTARGVWAVVTGEADVESPRTASRNPAAVDQHTIINDLKEYAKFYFLGGSTSWANVRALLTNNISDLQLYEEGNYKSSAINVWGISDKRLFLEANNVLKQQQKPFFAIIQTADNHRPYTIPSEDRAEFTLKQYSKDSLIPNGFDNNDQLNAFRYTDFCFQKFIEAAKKEKYFANTIFVFVGDHGVIGNAGDMFPKCWTEMTLTKEHVPLLFYSPSLLKPQRIAGTCSQADLMPSVASLIGIPYRNTTLGRDVFDTLKNSQLPFAEKAFLFDPDERKIGMMTNEYCYMKDLQSGKEKFMSAKNNDPLPLTSQTDHDKNVMQNLTNAYFETGKYMLLNNAKNLKSDR